MVKYRCILIVAVVFLGLSFTGRDESPYRLRVPLGLDEYVPIPEDNPLAVEKIELGKQLFFDKRLSRDGTIACASCHVPEKAFAGESRLAVGIKGQRGTRNVPSIVNRAYGKSHFWDGRAKSLEEQALDPIQNPTEMDLTLSQLELRLKSDRQYSEAFQKVFGTPPSMQNTAQAIASFVRTLLSGDSPFDRFVQGDRQALSESAQRGLQIFRGKGNCIACHSGPLFSDEQFHNTGVGWENEPFDYGRFGVTKDENDRGKFKTPSLRNVALTTPYTHNGSLATLEEVVDFYNKGCKSNAHLDQEIRPLNFTATEKADLIVFLRSLTSEQPSNKP
jgi:cytochrome c peroxidase